MLKNTPVVIMIHVQARVFACRGCFPLSFPVVYDAHFIVPNKIIVSAKGINRWAPGWTAFYS